MTAARGVDEYIGAAPEGARISLRKVRAAIREGAPEAEESISYGMPFYSYKGERGVERRLCYFGVSGRNIGLYFRPKDLEPHVEEVARYKSAKSALRFPIDGPIPTVLIKKLVRDAVRRHRAPSSA